jgi:rhamnogalacturonyl hydrolase YesR
MKTILFGLALGMATLPTFAQNTEVNDVNTPLHLMKPIYETPYGVPKEADVKACMDRVLTYLESTMPAEAKDNRLHQGSFRLTSYEAGVLYNAMWGAAKRASDTRYKQFVTDRLGLIAQLAPFVSERMKKDKNFDPQMRLVVNPQALDDAGAMCAAFIRMQLSETDKKKKEANRLVIERYINHVMNKQYRLADGILARTRPHYNTVWLDDMYMGIPCLAWYGKLTGETKYYDEAVRQVRLFKERMWVPEEKLFRHGWVEEMNPHPFFPWGRANGWALLTLCEVLDALPTNYAGRTEVLDLLRQHVEGLCAVQDKTGFWHQLLNRNDTYLETSATAIYAYCMAHALCEGWIDAITYGAQTLQAWQAVQTKVNQKGQVEGTCVGSGMGFDVAFYSYRPVHPMAAHGYGPVIWAGGEIIRMLRTTHPKLNDSAIQFYSKEQKTNQPIFHEEK